MGFADDLIKNKKKLEEQMSGNSGSSFADTLIANKQLMNQASTIGTLDNVNGVAPTIDANTITNQLTNVVKQTTPILPQKDNMNLGQKLGYVGESFGSGILGGATQMINAPSQNVQEGAEIAQNKTTAQNLQSLLYKNMLPGSLGRIPDVINGLNAIAADPNMGGWKKALNMALEIANGYSFAGKLEDVGQLYGFAQQLLNRNGAKDIQQSRDILQTPSKALQKDVAKKEENLSGGWKLAGQVGQATGNMIPSIGLSLLTGDPSSASAQALSLASMGVSTKGQATEEALNKGANLSEANRIGAAKGMVEVGTEKLTGGLSWFGKGPADQIAEKIINDNVKNSIANFALKKIIGGLGEVGEEVISDIAGIAIDKATTDPNASLKSYFKNGDFWNTVITTLLTTGILETGYDVAGKAMTGKSAYQINKEELGRIGKVQDMVNEEISNTDTSKMSNKEINELKSQLETKYTNMLEQGVRDIISQADEEAFYQGKRTGGSELQEVEQQDIEDTANALNLEESPNNIEENIEENIQEENATTPTATELELNLENQTQNQTQNNINVTTGLEDYIKNNNLTELTQENIDDYINQILEEQQTNLTEQERKSLIDEYQDIIKNYAKDNGIPVIESPKIEIPDMTAESKAPSKAIGRETRNEIKNQVNAFNNAVKSDQYKVGNQVKEQYKNLEQKSINKLDNDALFYNQLEQKKNTFTQKQGNYVYKPSDNPRIDAFRRSAATYFKNNGYTQAFAKVAEKVIRDKGISVRFDPNLKSNAQITNKDSIVINPNSNRAAEFLLTHELTHAIGNKQMLKMIETYRKSNAEFDEAVKKLIGTYKASEINEEALADISGQLFGNQEFINNLSMEKPSLFKRLYNEIKYMWHQLRGYKNQNEFVEDLYNKWTAAYNKNIAKNKNVANDDIRYSIEETNDGTKYVDVNTNQDIFDGKNIKEQTKLAKQYILDNFRGKGLAIGEDTANVTRQTANEYTHPRKELQKKDASSKMKASTELDNLLKASQYKYSKADDGRHSFAKDGWDYYETTFKVGDNTYTGLINIAKNGNKKMLYDITNLKRNTQISSPVNTATESIGIPFLGKNISQNEDNVKSIQGLEDYTREEIKNITNNYIKQVLEDNGYDDIEIINSDIHGSRGRGTAKADSDLDIVVQYNGDIREDDFFNMLNDNGDDNLYINGIKVDINPIKENLSDYMERSNEYDKEVLNKNVKLSKEELDNSSFSIDNKTGKLQENGKDVKLETSTTGDTGTLMAIHNLSEDKLKGILELGGFPVPSIAVTNPNLVDHKGYGNISVLFDKSTINPTNKNNEIYDRDVWSPKFPQTDREINSKNIDKVAPKIGMSDSSLQSLAEDYNNVDDLAYRLSRDTDIIEKYLKDNNIEYDNDTNIHNLAKENGIEDFLKAQLKDVYGEKGIWNQKGYLTDSGNRRTFWQTHDKYNLENVVKNIIKQKTVGSHVDFTGESFGNIQARMANKFKSIEDIKKNESRIMSKTDADAVVGALADRLNSSMVELAKLYGDKFDALWDMDSINYQIQELSRAKNVSVDEYYNIANKYNPTLAKADKKTVQDIVDTMNELKNIPTDYFEAKPQRAVGLDEVQQIVIPNNTSAEFKKQLQDAGLQYTEYDPNIEGDRQRVINQFDNLKFSKENETWREYLEKEFPAQGTTTSFNDMLGKETKKTNNTTPEAKTPQNGASNKATKGNTNDKIINQIKSFNLDENNIAKYSKEEIIKEIEQKYSNLSDEKIKQIIDLRLEQRKKDALYSNYIDTKKAKQRQMVNAYETNAKIRKIVQGDSLQKVKGGLTDTELAKAIKKENSNYIGKKVIVDGQNGTVVGNPYGRVKVEFENGLTKTFDADEVESANKNDVITAKDAKGNKIDLKPTKKSTYERVETPKKTDVMPDMSNDTVTIGDKKVSNFYSNITEKSKFITEENRETLKDNENLKYYDAITNKDTLLDAMGKLDANAEQQIGDFFAKDSFNAEDMATGWILIKRYQDAGNYEAMSNVIETMRDKGTKSGQAIQMLGMLDRLTPEGMEFYAQRQLDNAYNKFVENKSKKEIDKYAQDFTLTPEEHQFIKDTMEKVEKMTNEDDKKVEVAKIVKMLSDKLPPEKGSRVKAWMRISMLGNPKTQVRNVAGNAIIQPLNWLGDTVASRIDKIMSKKTGIRTKGDTDFGALSGGFVKGAKEAVRDAKLGIDTRDINLNRFEENIGAKPFYEGHKSKALNVGAKVLNKTNQILGNVMSGGDRVFYQAIYDNSLKNQMKLNNVTTPTQEMMQIAEQEALSRTWNDSNEYTKAVLQIRNAMNKLNVKGYGLGDVLVPFAKTPANLTKAIVDYSPVGLVRSILQDGKNYRNSLQNGQYNAQIQHKFADSLGKGFAGTVLWAAAYALAQAGITSGASDDDKDVANFMRNTLGIQPYSIKIGNKSFTYDWAQPIAAPFAAMADFKRLSEKEEKDFGTIVQTAISSASNILLEQSFLSSIQDVFNSYEGPAAAIKQQIEDLPARATPTFFKQIADLIDPVQRQTYVKGNTGETLKNKVQVKIPGASKELTSQRDTLGREIKKYGGDDNIAQYAFNVFLNPANTNKGKPSAAAEEIYDVYKNTGDKTVMPRQVGYSENVGGTTIPLSAEERNEWQRLSGEKIEDSVKALTSNPKYNSMSYEDKADVINGIVNYSFAKAKSDMFGTQISTQYKTASKKEAEGIPIADYYVDRISKRK